MTVIQPNQVAPVGSQAGDYVTILIITYVITITYVCDILLHVYACFALALNCVCVQTGFNGQSIQSTPFGCREASGRVSRSAQLEHVDQQYTPSHGGLPGASNQHGISSRPLSAPDLSGFIRSSLDSYKPTGY